MGSEMQSAQALAPGEAYLIEEFPPSIQPCIRSQLDSAKQFPVPGAHSTTLSPSPVNKMKALPQRPGPGGSRVTKKRPSIPHLGDGLITVFSPKDTLTKSTTCIQPEAPATLTSSNLNQFVKSTHSDGDFGLSGTHSTCSDEDIILIGTPNHSTDSNLSSRPSSGSGTLWGADTPPTTLTGDDSFSSDEEITLNLSSSTPIDGKTGFSSKSTRSSTYRSNNPTMKNKLLSPITFSFSRKDGDTHNPRLMAHHSTNESSESFEAVPVHTTIKAVPTVEIIPNVESLHGIVRSFLASETTTKSVSSSIARSQLSPSPTLDATNKAKPFWNPERIFEFYIKGAITPAKARETARRHGYPDVIPAINEAELLKKKKPSLRISDIVTMAANEGKFGILDQPTETISAETSQREQHGTAYHDFMLKLATYSAKDNSAGPVKPLHIFVDMSNIHIGFCNSWKISQNIPVERRIRAPTFNFKVLASIMERNRAAKKKVLASSVASHIVSRMQWPQHFVDAERQGYKTSILSRVQKVSPVKPGRRRKTSVQGPSVTYPLNLMTSGDESSEETTRASYETRNGEQGVDEILHLNMMNSILDDMQEPGSMVLATGDAAQAEFSEGFLEYANRALSQGWNLELVTWKSTISSAWMNPAFRTKHGEHFRIIYLDDFLEELNADLRPSLA
ncbi:hypothetical protein F4803DRAFT_337331 [Xylaria telfairii]|nr:hypothetical protein F4803DRAFT_337331 [Xylaria telfairii]